MANRKVVVVLDLTETEQTIIARDLEVPVNKMTENEIKGWVERTILRKLLEFATRIPPPTKER